MDKIATIDSRLSRSGIYAVDAGAVVKGGKIGAPGKISKPQKAALAGGAGAAIGLTEADLTPVKPVGFKAGPFTRSPLSST